MDDPSPSTATLSVRLRTFRDLTAREYTLLAVTIPLIVAVRGALWVLPSPLILRFVTRISGDEGVDSPTPRFDLSSIIWAVERSSMRVPRASCLTQAICGKLLLRWSGLHAGLCLGVARAFSGTLRAHAWLERDGRTILGGIAAQTMVRLPELPDLRRSAARSRWSDVSS